MALIELMHCRSGPWSQHLMGASNITHREFPAYRDREPAVGLEWTATWREARTRACPPAKARHDARSGGGTHHRFRPSTDGAAGASQRGEPNGQRVAQRLSMSWRTLQRRLEAGGTTFPHPPGQDTLPAGAGVA